MAVNDLLKEDADHLLNENGNQILLSPPDYTYAVITAAILMVGVATAAFSPLVPSPPQVSRTLKTLKRRIPLYPAVPRRR